MTSANLRKPDYLPPTEVQSALVAIVGQHCGVDADETAPEVARLLGFKSTSMQLRQMVHDEVNLLLQQFVLEQRQGKLYVPSESTKVLT